MLTFNLLLIKKEKDKMVFRLKFHDFFEFSFASMIQQNVYTVHTSDETIREYFWKTHQKYITFFKSYFKI